MPTCSVIATSTAFFTILFGSGCATTPEPIARKSRPAPELAAAVIDDRVVTRAFSLSVPRDLELVGPAHPFFDAIEPSSHAELWLGPRDHEALQPRVNVKIYHTDDEINATTCHSLATSLLGSGLEGEELLELELGPTCFIHGVSRWRGQQASAEIALTSATIQIFALGADSSELIDLVRTIVGSMRLESGFDQVARALQP